MVKGGDPGGLDGGREVGGGNGPPSGYPANPGETASLKCVTGTFGDGSDDELDFTCTQENPPPPDYYAQPNLYEGSYGMTWVNSDNPTIDLYNADCS